MGRRIWKGEWAGRLMRVSVPHAHDDRWGTIEGLIFLVISEPESRWSEFEMDFVDQVQIWARGVKRWWTLSFVSYQTDLLNDAP
jgi:hypothetical protein